MITKHQCFIYDNFDECHHPNNENNFECIWCEYWCVYKKEANDSKNCHYFSPLLNELFEQPKIEEIKPKVVFANVPTMINIYGKYFDRHDSPEVYNEVNGVFFNGEYACTIQNKSFDSIRCVIENIDNKTDEINLELVYSRNVFDLNLKTQLKTNISLKIWPHLDYEHLTKNFINDNDRNEFIWNEIAFEIEIILGLIIGMLLYSFCWFIISKRSYFKQKYESIKLRFYLKKMKKMLVEKNLYVDYKSVEFKNKIGQGNFGEVYAALVSTKDGKEQNVAIKKLRKGTNYLKMKMFITEGIKMNTFRHDRILTPLAIYIDRSNHMPSIVLPLMFNGDLRRYLQQQRSFPIVKLLKFALQIAEGMEYLSSKNFVHGDLAARNCLIDENFDVKIGDFGLSRQLYKGDYDIINETYQPIRWMAIECLVIKYPKFTKKSDIWSFGIVIWEIFTLGSYPYEDIDNKDLCQYLLNGHRLPQPSSCPQKIYEIMCKCWLKDWINRPSFDLLCREIRIITSSISQEQQRQQRECENNHDKNDQIDKPIMAVNINNIYSNYTSLAERFIQTSTLKFSSSSCIPDNHNLNDDENDNYVRCYIEEEE